MQTSTSDPGLTLARARRSAPRRPRRQATPSLPAGPGRPHWMTPQRGAASTAFPPKKSLKKLKNRPRALRVA